MDSVVDRPWSTERFLAWEDRQEGRHEFDGSRVIPMTGGSFAHQDIVFNLRALLARLLAGTSLRAVQEMRLRIGARVRYPDVLVCADAQSPTVRTVDDAVVIVEVLSDDTAATDRVDKLIDYAQVPSMRYYIMLEQASPAAVVCQRGSGGAWMTTAQTAGVVALPELGLALPFEDIYRGLVFPTVADERSVG